MINLFANDIICFIIFFSFFYILIILLLVTAIFKVTDIFELADHKNIILF